MQSQPLRILLKARPEIWRNRRIFRGLLADLYPAEKRIRVLLLCILDIGIVSELQSGGKLSRVDFNKLVHRVHHHYPFELAILEEAVLCWCESLDVEVEPAGPNVPELGNKAASPIDPVQPPANFQAKSTAGKGSSSVAIPQPDPHQLTPKKTRPKQAWRLTYEQAQNLGSGSIRRKRRKSAPWQSRFSLSSVLVLMGLAVLIVASSYLFYPVVVQGLWISSVDGGWAVSRGWIGISGKSDLTIPATYWGKPIVAISDYGFRNCRSLVNIIVPDNVTSIGQNAFEGCTKLQHIKLPGNLQVLRKNALLNCSELKEISIPDSVTKLEPAVFKGCRSLSDAVLSEAISTIPQDAFAECSGLTTVVVPDHIAEIGDYAFGDCTNLVKIELPAKLEKLGYCCFANCSSLAAVDIPPNITELGESSFDGCIQLTKASLPAALQVIGQSAFADCENLETINIPLNLQRVESFAFKNCQKLTRIRLPQSVTVIGEGAFRNCRALKSLELPPRLAELGAYAFADCYVLESVLMPSSVAKKGYGVFENCHKLKVR